MRRARDFALGSVGAGLGATTANFKGGLGSASAQTDGGVTVGALAVVNARRQRHGRRRAVVLGGAVRESTTNSADADCRPRSRPTCCRRAAQGRPGRNAPENTTLVVVVTDAVLTKTQAKRLAMIAQTGMARAIYPVHAPLDGDVVFAAATGKKPVDPLFGLTELGMVAANTVARAIARGVYQCDRAALSGRATGVGRSLRLGRIRSDLAGSRVQALTESEATWWPMNRLGLPLDHLLDEIVGRCRGAGEVPPAADVIVTLEPSA